MNDFVICGSCYTLVTSDGETCPRCRMKLHPTEQDTLRKFIDNGIDPTKKGVPVKKAQDAALSTLNKLEEYERFLDWLLDADTPTLERIIEVAKLTREGKGA